MTVPFRHEFLTSNFILAAEKQSDSDFTKSVIKPVNGIIVSLLFGFSKYWMTMGIKVSDFSFKPIGSSSSWRRFTVIEKQSVFQQLFNKIFYGANMCNILTIFFCSLAAGGP